MASHTICVQPKFTAVSALQCFGQITSPLSTKLARLKCPLSFGIGLEQKGEKNTSLCVKMVSLGRSDLDQYTIQFQTPHALMGWDEIHCGAWYTSLTYQTHQTYQAQKSHP